MAEVTSEQIKTLRHITGAGLVKCKEALVASNGDIEQAVLYLRKLGALTAEKKESREVNEGIASVLETESSIIFVEVNCETDFVASNDKFKAFVKDLAEELSLFGSTDKEAFLATQYSKDSSMTINEVRTSFIQSSGENIAIGRLEIWNKQPNASYGIYVHGNGGSIAAVECLGSSSVSDLSKDIALHCVASRPRYVSADQVPASILEQEKDVCSAQIEGKPANIVEKILKGKIDTFLSENCLLQQKFVKDSSKTISEIVAERSASIGAELSIAKFVRWQIKD